MESKVKVTKELNEILIRVFSDARKDKIVKISPFYMLSKILIDQLEGKISNKVLEEFLDGCDKENTLNIFKESLQNEINNLKHPGVEVDTIVFTTELTDSFEFVLRNLSIDLTITTEALVYELLNHYEFDIDFLDCDELLDIINKNKKETEENITKIADDFMKILESMCSKDNPKTDIEKLLRNPEGSVIMPKPIPEDLQKEDDKNFEKYGSNDPINSSELDLNSPTPILDQFSDDMTENARKGYYDPVIGRDSIIDSIIEILCKRKKANVAIVGVAGSGKSSLVERLAQRIASGKVPEQLKKKRICSLDLNNLVAGTKYRGEYEERLQKIIKEVCSNKNIIVYIDELHNLVGSGGSQTGNGDGANILKPYLAKGQFQCIGSTTMDEYRKFIEKDAALNRRFTQVELKEPNTAETIKILNGIKSSYEKFHKVKFSKEVIEACVNWSGRYITDKHQPDKAIDILDLCGSLASLNKIESKTEKDPDTIELEKTIKDKIEAITKKCDYELGEQLYDHEQELRAKIEKNSNTNGKNNWTEVTIENVATAISKVSKVPIDKINQTDREMIKKMKNELSRLVIGQDKAITEVVRNIQRSYLGLRQPGKPIFTGLFVGNTGTGKTLICKEIARIFFGSEQNLIKIDCGELRDKGSVSKLLGTTAGYIGYDQAPLLDQVKRKPSSVLLLDEIEKCDPSIYEIFMNILDEGYCVLGDSTRVDFTNTIIIFTGNVGTKEIREEGGKIGFVEENKQTRTEAIVKKAIDKTFKPEFINRLSSIVIFNELGKPEMSKIYNLEVNKFKKLLKDNKKLTLKVSEQVKNKILNKINYNYGARDLKRLIEDIIVNPVSDMMTEDTEANVFNVVLDDKENSKVVVE